MSKKRDKKLGTQLADANKRLAENNANTKALGDKNKQLESQLKAKQAELEARIQLAKEQQEQITHLETKAVTIIESPEDPGVQILQKIMDMSFEAQMNQHMTEEERAKSALRFQKELNEQRLEYLRGENQIRCESPEVLEAKANNEFKRKIHFWVLILAAFLSVFGAGLLAWSLFGGGVPAAIIGIGILATGLFILLLGLVHYISPEDAAKVERLAKVFRVPDQFKGLIPGRGGAGPESAAVPDAGL